MTGEVDGVSFGENEETKTGFGLLLLGGVDLYLGPGALLAELQFGWGPLDAYVLRDTNLGTLGLSVGYRLIFRARSKRRCHPLAGGGIVGGVIGGVHTPATQLCIAGQAMLQPPQLAASVRVSTHLPLQADRPALHAITHWPRSHLAEPFEGATHGVLQPPQCSGSLSTFTHALPHRIAEPSHWKSHMLPLHKGRAFAGALHARPQPPQWAVSLRVSTHEPPHSTAGAAQSSTHVPPSQVSPAAHLRPHAPQFALLFVRFTQAPAQGLKPARQATPHVPALQVA